MKRTKLLSAERFARPVSRWTSPMELPPVDLQALMVEVEVYGRPLHQVARVRESFGLPATDPQLEERLKELELWPRDARPLPIPADDLLYMAPPPERIVAYGLLMGLSVKEIAKQTAMSLQQSYYYIRTLQDRWRILAELFRVIDGETYTKQGVVGIKTLKKALGHQGEWLLYGELKKTGLPLWRYAGLYLRDFPVFWSVARRWEDMPTWFDSQAKEYVFASVWKERHPQTAVAGN